MRTLATELRRQLERTVVEARDIAEAGARGALETLAVHHHEPYSHMSPEQRKLRNRLRAHARHLGDRVDARSGAHTIDHLVHECACEHWHGMLFARFLAENHLLIEPEMEVAITLDECEELAKEEGVDKWALAARFAHSMLPQVFRPDHPVFEVQFAREYRLKLEGLVEALPEQVFTATDALGWVYQFWQTRKKDEVNRSEVKIGADELPAVTQLFTEPYMVQFLLHNSLGAWWVSRHPGKVCPVDLTYLRRTEEGTLAAGGFEGWPDDLGEFRLLDPCCGSGHFLVAAFLMLVPMRMALGGLDAAEAVDAVLRENIHGMELDQRCVAIAAFALALEAWRFPDAGGFRTLPKFNLAWCGQPVADKKERWLALAEGDPRLEAGMAALYDTFRDAPILGSLIDPTRSVSDDMLTAGFEEVQPLLEKALREHVGEEEWEETAIAALGLAEATGLLSSHYHLVVTNVPYLARGKQNERLRKFAETRYPKAKNDLANVFLERCLDFSKVEGVGVTQIVMPQNWLFLTTYKGQREHLLRDVRWELLARLGPGAFETIGGEVVNVILLTMTGGLPRADHHIWGIDASASRLVTKKAEILQNGQLIAVRQLEQLENPDATIRLAVRPPAGYLRDYAGCYQGLTTGDDPKLKRLFWELNSDLKLCGEWVYFQGPSKGSGSFGGRSNVVDARMANDELGLGVLRGREAWGKRGIAIDRVSSLSAAHYTGDFYHSLIPVLIPLSDRHLPAIAAFAFSDRLQTAAKEASQALSIDNGYFEKFEFEIEFWEEVGNKHFPHGLPNPYSDDPTQWIFQGHPCGSVVWDEDRKCTVHGPLRTDETVLQVAVTRLLGYRWPAENDSNMDLAEEQRVWVEKTKALCPFEDEDGIVCIPSVRGEQPADERLLQLLQAAYGDDWHDGILTELFAESGSTSLDDWLRNHFFDEHCKLFRHRPFIWHIWDGRKRDGFHALVTYHKLAESDGKGRRLLESLTYSYLGDWINRQDDGVKRGEGGTEDRLAAALELQKRLVAILEGEPPFDIFVRWKPIEEQPIGWEPDINDGVRLNIRPFMTGDLPGGKKDAGILRARPNIRWKKDRGKEPAREQAQFPWFWNNGRFTGERVNDIHLTNAEKHAAREQAGGK